MRGIVLIAAAAVLFGTAGVAAKLLGGFGHAEPISIGFYRLAIAAPLLLLCGGALGGLRSLQVARRDWLALTLIALSQAAYQGLYFGAVARIGVTLAALIALCSAPVLVTLLSAAFLGETITRRLALCVAIAVAGVALLVGVPGPSSAEGSDLWAGIAMAGCAALAYAVFALSSWTLAERYPPATLVGLGFGLGALLLAPAALHAGLEVTGGSAAWGLVIYIGLGATALAYALFFAGLPHVRPAATGLVVLFEPLTSALLAAVLFGERLGLAGLAGGVLLLIAVVTLPRTSPRGQG